jgi:hypothetical protein
VTGQLEATHRFETVGMLVRPTRVEVLLADALGVAPADLFVADDAPL